MGLLVAPRHCCAIACSRPPHRSLAPTCSPPPLRLAPPSLFFASAAITRDMCARLPLPLRLPARPSFPAGWPVLLLLPFPLPPISACPSLLAVCVFLAAPSRTTSSRTWTARHVKTKKSTLLYEVILQHVLHVLHQDEADSFGTMLHHRHACRPRRKPPPLTRGSTDRRSALLKPKGSQAGFDSQKKKRCLHSASLDFSLSKPVHSHTYMSACHSTGITLIKLFWLRK